MEKKIKEEGSQEDNEKEEEEDRAFVERGKEMTIR